MGWYTESNSHVRTLWYWEKIVLFRLH